MIASDCFVSVVAPVCNDAAIIDDFIREVMEVLRKSYSNYELVLVDDGSDDDTAGRIASLLERYECIRLIRLSRKFGEEVAIFAGLESVIGDFVVVLLPNWDPPVLIPDLIQRTREGAEIVFGVTQNRKKDGWLISLGSRLFDWYCRRVLELNLPRNSTQFRALSRQAVNAVVQVKNAHRYLRILSAEVGYTKKSFLYQPINRLGLRRKRGLWEAVSVAVDVMIASSAHPLRFVSWLGILASSLNMLYTIYVVAIYFFKAKVAEGWTTLSLQNAAMFFFVFLILTVSSEYIGHILAETVERPLYYILEEKSSSVSLANEERRNVVYDSAGGGMAARKLSGG